MGALADSYYEYLLKVCINFNCLACGSMQP